MSRFPNRRWLVIPISEIPNIDFSQVLQPSVNSLRYSVDRSKTFVKYEVNVIEQTYEETYFDEESGEEKTYIVEAGTYGRPSVYSDEYPEYNHEQILELLSTSEWVDTTEY